MPDREGADVGAPDALDFAGEVSRMPGFLLRRTQQIAVSIFLEECEGLDLTPLQFAVLSALKGQEEMDQSRLARLAALDRTTASVVTRNLAARGLLHRERSKEDRRAWALSISREGAALLDSAAAPVLAAQSRILAPLSDAERKTFLLLLEKLCAGNNAASRAPVAGTEA